MDACKVLELITNNKIEKIKELAKLEIIQNSIKENRGNKELKRFKAAQRYIKSIEKDVTNKHLAGTWVEQGLQCFSNGYTAFILKNKIEGLPEIEQNNFNVHSILTNIKADKEIKIDINKIKANIKIHQATVRNKSVICECYIGISCYNAKYIQECCEILGGNVVFKQSKTNEFSPAILESENGVAALCPIRNNREVSA